MVEGETFRPTGIEDVVDATLSEFIDEMRILKEEEYNNLCSMLVRESTRLPPTLVKMASRLYSDKQL